MLCFTTTEPKQSIYPYVMLYHDRALTVHKLCFTTTDSKQSICYALSGQSLNNPYAMPYHER